MSTTTAAPDERLTSAHRARLAYIYRRQSSVTQIRHHQESAELQYRPVDGAIGLGWPRERVRVIDRISASRALDIPIGTASKG